MQTTQTTVNRAYPSWIQGRILHLIDVENIVGRSDFSTAEAAVARASYETVAPTGTVDQLIVATSHHTAPATWRAWPANVRRLLRSGPNGADLAILEVIEREAVASRFDHVVIGSGDGIFAEAAAVLQQRGSGITVVTRRLALSRKLAFAVRDVRFVDLAKPGLEVTLKVA